jgi:hypothetical protein
MLEEVYTHSKYKVKQAAKAEKGCLYGRNSRTAADLFLTRIEEDFTQEAVDEFNAGFPELTDQGVLDAMSEEEHDAFWQRYEEGWAQMFLDLCRQRLDSGEIDYGDETSIIVQFKPDASDGLYTIPDTDFKNLDALILQY